MEIKEALRPVGREHIQKLTRSELIDFALGEQDLRLQMEKKAALAKEEIFCLGDRYLRLKNKAFTPSSERKKQQRSGGSKKSPKRPETRHLKPSERYPDADIVDQDVELIPPPMCDCCGEQMVDSGMSEITENISVIPKKYLIKRQFLHKYSCRGCHGSLITAPTPPRIKSGSSYDDDLVIDVAVSKYCDLIPIERYCSIAARQGFSGLPPQSMIELTHYLAEFLLPVYKLIKKEVQASRVLHADETPHKMLEGSSKKNWYLWAFSNAFGCYFECHDTRSGDVAINFLSESECEILLTDVYAGYNKALRFANKIRESERMPAIRPAFCNAHARRKLRDLPGSSGDKFVENYAEIYHLNKRLTTLNSDEGSKIRNQMASIFERIYKDCEQEKEQFPLNSDPQRYLKYFTNNYEGLTNFLSDSEIPIDNNHQERLLRNPVIGRKVWHGTHSKRGARTHQILFTIIESCKLNKLNPRDFIHKVRKSLLRNLPAFSPHQMAIAEINSETG